jgi:hypothetical protein
MDVDEQIKSLEEQAGTIGDLRHRNHRDPRFTSWRKTTLKHLENIFEEGSEYVRRFETLTFHEPGFGVPSGSRASYSDMGSFRHDLDKAKTILEDGIEALRRLRPPKKTTKTPPKEAPSEEPLPKESQSDDLFFERAILEKTLSEQPVAEKTPEEDLTTRSQVLETSYKEDEPSVEEVIRGSQEESESSPGNQSVEEVVRYASSLLYHYISLEEDPKKRKTLQGLRAELDNAQRSKERIMQALKASWEEGKDILIDVIARVFAKKG